MSISDLNLARRPFVDTRLVNVLVAVLVVTAAVLSFNSFRTVKGYLDGSRVTREAVAELRTDIERLESQRRAAEEGLSRFDLEALTASAEEANALARKRAFSWTRFLSRLETVLPENVRVVAIGVNRAPEQPSLPSGGRAAEPPIKVTLSLVCRDLDGLPNVVRAFYASDYFDEPVPASEQGGEKGTGEGQALFLTVTYIDSGRRR